MIIFAWDSLSLVILLEAIVTLNLVQSTWKLDDLEILGPLGHSGLSL